MMVNTARGSVDASSLGRTLPHEHIYLNLLSDFRGTGLLNDPQLMEGEVRAFRDAGGTTIVDLTPSELTVGGAPDPTGRFIGHHDSGYADHGTRTLNNVLALRELSERTGVNVVLGTGHYRDPYFRSSWLSRRSVEEVAERMILDVAEGFPGSDVRAGIVGEIGNDQWQMSALEERSFRAAGRAHRATGVTVSTHAPNWPMGMMQLDMLAEESVDPQRVIVGHCDTVNIPEYHLAIARRGAYVQFDTIRGGANYDIERRAGFVVHLVRAGFLSQILLSHDVCRRDHLKSMGGFGFVYIFEHFRAVLGELGLETDEMESILVDNPRRALGG